MDGFLHTLLTMSLTAAIAAGVVMLLRLLLKRVPRWITCLLWAVVLLRMVCPVGFSLPVSLMPETVSSGAYVERVLPQSETPASTPQAATTTTTVPAATTQTPVTRETVAVTPTGPDRNTVLTILWAAGSIACLAWGAVSYLRLRLRIADAILIEKNVYETDQIDSPFVCGFFRPRIYLPVGLAEPDRRYVLLHEQAHIRRRDYLTKPLAYVTLCFHWFNPVLWLSYHLFGRDIETATDQAVIRSFGRTDTASYAAALLHLGHKPSFPQAIPLAFGEENPKHRIRSVLSYKKPAFWVILAAVAACVVLGVLLLADRSQPEEITLDGQTVRQASMVDVLSVTDNRVSSNLPITDLPVMIPLSDELAREVTGLIDQAEQGEETTVSDAEDLPEKTIVFSTPNGDIYQLRNESGSFSLWRNTIDGDCHRRTLTFQDQRIETWLADAAAYVSVGRADDLYQLRTPYVGNNVAVANVVGSFQLNEVLGPYTIELQTSQEPYGILLHLEQDLTSETARRYLEEMSSLILALIDNAGYVAYTTPSEPTPQDTGAITKEANPKMNQPDLETFRLLYATHFTRMEPYYPGKLTGDCYSVKDLLYFNATLVEKPQATVAETKAYYENFKLVWSGGYLAVRWADGSEQGQYVYRDTSLEDGSPLPEIIRTLSGQRFDMYDEETYACWRFVSFKANEDTGYRCYLKGESTYFAYYSQGQLAYLAEVERGIG
ncbi:M56 family metallopeptidase [Evtepia sp.]|uniref:M56 family metallopeptidase n=1 Tax=Evtepia sp. TaxID=2773933 RepID=UPI002E7A4C17|nr:M56 family metallopeptidase [Evtepia sp.]MEE0256064.1 M56 family metallopeptidase [Evtepia sp.]